MFGKGDALELFETLLFVPFVSPILLSSNKTLSVIPPLRLSEIFSKEIFDGVLCVKFDSFAQILSIVEFPTFAGAPVLFCNMLSVVLLSI